MSRAMCWTVLGLLFATFAVPAPAKRVEALPLEGVTGYPLGGVPPSLV